MGAAKFSPPEWAWASRSGLGPIGPACHIRGPPCTHLGNGRGNAMLHFATTVPTIGRPFGVRKFLGKWRS